MFLINFDFNFFFIFVVIKDRLVILLLKKLFNLNFLCFRVFLLVGFILFFYEFVLGRGFVDCWDSINMERYLLLGDLIVWIESFLVELGDVEI